MRLLRDNSLTIVLMLLFGGGGGSPARFTPGCWASRSASCLSCRLCCTGPTAPALRRRTRWNMARLPRLSFDI